MPTTISTPVKHLKLDLHNFRTVPQTDEIEAVQAMISSRPDHFWALMESLLESGYLPTENILVLQEEIDQSELIVKEGNRRIAVLKLIHGYLSSNDIAIPDNIMNKIQNLPTQWKIENELVPCTIYTRDEAWTVDKIVTLAHGKGEKAGRDQWNAVARARHSRSVNNSNEPALDLLEKYLETDTSLDALTAKRWAGDFPLTILEDAMKKIAPRLGVRNTSDLAKQYPAIQYRDALDEIIKDIGYKIIDFKQIRSREDFAIPYGVPPASSSHAGASGGAGSQAQGPQGRASGATGGAAQGGTAAGSVGKKAAAVATHDPEAVKRVLGKFKPLGNNREKVVALRKEAYELNLARTPLAFCFVLRSMFEISAKAYCIDHQASGGPSATHADGTDRSLVDVLRDITTYMTTLPNQKKDKATIKALHGAIQELDRPAGILSVTSMNQLVHNPSFSITASDISTMFGNIFPLLEAMNR